MAEALRAGGVQEVLLAEGRKASHVLDEIRGLARGLDVPVREVSPSEIGRLAPGQNTQGVAASVRERRLDGVADLLAALPRDAAPFLLAIDQVQDPHNLGALLRTGAAAGIHGAVLPTRRSAHITGIVAKTSAGAVSRVNVCTVTNLSRTLETLKKAGIWTVGLHTDATETIYDIDLTGPTCLVVGAEGEGLRRLTRAQCDLLAYIPMPGDIESLNASVAGSIAMYEVVRQRRAQ